MTMKDFLDLEGASGAVYRFRHAAPGELRPRMGGNFAVVKPRAKGFTVRFVGATNDLSQAQATCPPEVLKGAQLYIRLNVPRGQREAEHQDLLANYGPTEPETD
jgi:hypothetical protein